MAKITHSHWRQGNDRCKTDCWNPNHRCHTLDVTHTPVCVWLKNEKERCNSAVDVNVDVNGVVDQNKIKCSQQV